MLRMERTRIRDVEDGKVHRKLRRMRLLRES
jgi:hypothetical protein